MGGKLLAGAGITIALAGCGATKTLTQTSTVTQTETQTVTRSAKRRAPTKTVTVTNTITAPAPAAAPAAAQDSSNGSSFSGNGGKNLGTITVANDSTLSWTNDGDIFQILDPQENLIINSQAHSGTSAISAGTYHNVYVNAIGNWKIKISPG